jgi:hypothetical protein
VLHIDFFCLIAGPGAVQSGQGAIGEPGGKFFLVEGAGAGTDFAKEEPGFALGLGRLALLEEGAEGSDASAGTAHDDGDVFLWSGKAEAFACVDEDWDGGGSQ